MKKLTILAFLLLFASQAAFAQRISTISAVATDDKTAEKINGAVLMLISVADTTVVKYGLANSEGKIAITSVPFGDYTAKLSRIGYEDYVQKLTVNARTMNLGTLFLKESAIELDEVTVSTQAIRTSQQGDTLIYNAKAFKVPADADADELLKKLPGVMVGNDGTVTAQGEQVQKIYVDGKESFGTDVTAAMKNVPAQNVEKVEVFRKLSDFSEKTGINDGNDFMAMNLVTNMKFGQIGRISAGYNFQDKYDIMMNYRIFNKVHTLALSGMSNNTGALNFGGNSSFGGSGIFSGGTNRFGGIRMNVNGIDISGNNAKSTTHSIGLNYNYEKTKKFRADLSYRFGYSDSESKRKSETEYLDSSRPFDKRYSIVNSSSTNNQHTVGGRIQWQINDKQDLSFRPDLSFRNSPRSSFTQTTDKTVSGGIEELFRDIANSKTSHTDQYNLRGNANYTLRFNKPKRSLSVELSGALTKDNGDSLRYSTYAFPAPRPDSIGQSKSISISESQRIGIRTTFVEPISEFWNLMASYSFSGNYSDRNADTYKKDFDTGEYVTWGENSNIMRTSDFTHRIGPGINYTRNRDAININLNYQYTVLKGKRTLPTPAYDSQATFQNLVYDASYRKNFNPQNSIEFRTASSTNNPSINQLQDVDNINSAPYYTSGNSKLTPSTNYNYNLIYTRTSLTRGYTFMAFANLNQSYNNIGDSTIIITENMLTNDSWVSPHGTILKLGDQYSKPINIGSGWGASGNVNFGKPLNFIKSNFNVNASYHYSENDSYFNGKASRAYSHGIGSAVSLSTNFSEKFTANLNYSFNYSFSQYSAADQKDVASLNHRINFDLKWLTWKDFLIATDISYGLNRGITYNYRFENTICNVTLGKKLFKNNRGELSLTVHDLFNQNKSFSTIVRSYSIEKRTENLIQRYFTVNFSYTLRNINSTNAPDRGPRMERGRDFIPLGPPIRMGGGRFM